MNEPRQRNVRALSTALLACGLLAAGVGCQARSPGEGAQTAVALAQTVVPGAVDASQSMVAQLQVLLAGANVEVKTTPSGVSNDQVTEASLTGTDARGTLAQADSRARAAAASAALVLVGGYFPNATVSLKVVDASGATLVSGTKAPGQAPAIQ